ncbi:MAG: lysophospholipid acyltransferase family protein [Bacteroidales bacterium]
MKITRENIIYAPINLLLHLVALLPFRVLFIVSDIIYFLLYYVIRYRVKVVSQHIKDSFPEHNTVERTKIVKGFYKHLTDYFLETIKLIHISDDQMRKRMIFEGAELIDNSLKRNRSVVAYAAHYGNWEYLTSISLWLESSNNDKVTISQIYRPLSNKWFDAYMLKLRVRFNTVCFSKKSTFRHLFKIKREGGAFLTGFISDQRPSGTDTKHIVKFLNHDTSFITGSETIARKLDTDVVYLDVEKVSRGKYKTTIRPIYIAGVTIESKDSIAITDCYAAMLEQTINRNPSLWLWSHKRWKKNKN